MDMQSEHCKQDIHAPTAETSTPDWAKYYLLRGYDPIPLGERSKKPLGAGGNLSARLKNDMGLQAFSSWGWAKNRIESENDIARYFHKRTNIGIALGTRSDGLVDIDLDWQEAAKLADVLFKDLPSFGRDGHPRSHRLAVCPDAERKAVFQLKSSEAIAVGLENEKAVIVELRGNGHYTVFPPSIHEGTGENIKWYGDGWDNIPRTEWDQLSSRCALCAFLAVVLRSYPRHSGDRDNICLALTGALLSARLDVEQVDELVTLVAKLADDGEASKRGTKAKHTKDKMDSNEPCWGLPELVKRLDIEGLESTLRQWLYPHGEVTTVSSNAIVATDGQLHNILQKAETALLAAQAPIYQRGPELVRPATLDHNQDNGGVRRERGVTVLMTLTPHYLVQEFARTAPWHRPRPKGNFVPTDPDLKYARHYMARAGEWRLRVLRGVVAAPTLREDGSILQTPGYDAASQLIYDPCGVEFPIVPESPTREDAKTAIKKFEPLFKGFPFVNKDSQAVVYTAVLTGLIRRTLTSAPLFALDAPTAGTGKSLAADTIGVIVTGHLPAAMSQGKNAEEDEKRLSTVLREGDQVILIDNVERPLGGDFLCSMLTQELIQARVLGKSERVLLPCSALVISTGNNLVLEGDISRRVVVCRMDAKVERPDKRQFDFDPRSVAREQRAELVVAGLTALRAYITAGRPCPLEKIGSFESWNLVRETLVWLDCGDPGNTRMAVFEDDPQKMEVFELLSAWYRFFKNKPRTLSELRHDYDGDYMSESQANLMQILVGICGGRDWNSRRIGWRLRRHKDQVVNGFVLRQMGSSSEGIRWQVEKVDIGNGDSGSA